MTFFCYGRFVGGSIGSGKLQFMIRTMVFNFLDDKHIQISSIHFFPSFCLQLCTPNMASVKIIYYVSVHAEPSRFRLTHETSFVRAHSNFWTKTPILFYFVRIFDRCCDYIIFFFPFFHLTQSNVNMVAF